MLRSILILFVFCLSSYLGNAQTATASFTGFSSKSSERNESMRLKRDAARLALRMDANNEDLRYLPISIQETKINAITKVLQAIKASELEAAQSIQNCKIHVLPSTSIDQFTIIYDKEIDWAAPLRKGINETESDDINDLLDEYDMFISKHINWNAKFDAITIQSHSPYNIAALAQEFNQIEGIEKVEYGNKQSDGNDIEIAKSGSSWLVTYYLRWGSCMNGCDNMHSWTFKVDASGKTSLVEEKGADIPAWMRCQNTSRKYTIVAR